jgi:hypothetical protein
MSEPTKKPTAPPPIDTEACRLAALTAIGEIRGRLGEVEVLLSDPALIQSWHATWVWSLANRLDFQLTTLIRELEFAAANVQETKKSQAILNVRQSAEISPTP